MELKPEDFVNRARNDKRERELARLLRQRPEEERFQFVQELLQHHASLGLHMATATLQQPKYFECLLAVGLRTADASFIKRWLECVVPKLGYRKVLLILSSNVETDVEAVNKALYWLPSFRTKNDAPTDDIVREIAAKIRNAEAAKLGNRTGVALV